MSYVIEGKNFLMNTGTIGEKITDIYTGSLTKNTKRAYINDILDFFQVESIADITLEKLKDVDVSSGNRFSERLLERGMAISTINRKLTALSSFYRILSRTEIGIVKYNPFDSREGNRRLKQTKSYSNTRCLTLEEIQMMVGATEQERNEVLALRNKIIMVLFATTGVRREEITSIKIGDFKPEMGKTIVEITGKGRKERMIMISETLKELIDKYIQMRGLTYQDKQEYLLVSHSSNTSFMGSSRLTEQAVYNVIKGLADIANIDSSTVSPHCLRHSYITLSIEMGISERDIADRVGHSDTRTTKRYEHTNRILKDNPADILSNQLNIK